MCNIPVHVLCEIFTILAQLRCEDSHWSWLNVTFVCSTWRRAALESPKLWRFIDFSHPRWTSLTLYRAHELPIFVSATVEAHNQSSLLRVLQFAPRISAIHLTSSIYNIGPLLGTLKLPHCHLQSLILDITSSEDNRDIRYSKRSYPCSGPPLPALNHLELYRAPFGLVSPRYTGLRHLSLHHLPFSERPTRQDFLSILEKFTLLEHLTLMRAFPKKEPGNSVYPTRCVHLPNLRTMSLTGSIEELVNVMECITLPPTCGLRCNIDRLNNFKTRFWKLAKVIGAHFHAASETPLDILVLTGREESFRFTQADELNPEFRQTLRVRVFGIVTKPMDAVLDVVIGPDVHTSHDEVLISALETLWEALPLGHLHTLTLRNADAITHKSWLKMLSSLSSLRVIDIGGHPASGLIWSLLLNARSYSRLEHDDAHGLLLPNLKDIYLNNIDCFSGGFMVSPSSHVNSHSDLDDSRFLDIFLSCLEDRHRCALSLRSLSISHCDRVSTETIYGLKGYVSHLMWDSQGRYKGEALDPESSATYRRNWLSVPPTRRHYYRLQRLLQME